MHTRALIEGRILQKLQGFGMISVFLPLIYCIAFDIINLSLGHINSFLGYLIIRISFQL
jgi:hypothetical protein